MKSYLDLLRHIIENGRLRDDRTGVGTLGVFGHQWRHNLNDGFPLLTTKKVHIKSIIHELLWFLRGETNVRSLQEAGVTIWNEWADANGDLGPVYGWQWRHWPTQEVPPPPALAFFKTIDQIAALIAGLKKNPFSRRHIVTAWNPADVPEMKLPPCHTLWQCYVESGAIGTGGQSQDYARLSLHLYARSIDSFLGLPFNIASYALLTHMLAHVCGYLVGDLVISFGDLHIYKNHFDQVGEQLSREPRALPRLTFARVVPTIDDFRFEDFVIEDYNPHSAIKAPVAV